MLRLVKGGKEAQQEWEGANTGVDAGVDAGADEDPEKGTNSSGSMSDEVRALRNALKAVGDELRGGESDITRVAAAIARLSDSIGRALLVEQKLKAAGAGEERERAEYEKFVRALGWDS